MPLKNLLLRNEKGWASLPLLTIRLLKENPRKGFKILLDSLLIMAGALYWNFLLEIVHLLNILRETAPLLALRKRLCKILPALRKYLFETPLPVNLAQKHTWIFKNDFYVLKPLQAISLKNYSLYLTSFSGIAFHNYRILPESIHGRWAKTRKTVFRDYYKQTMHAWLSASCGKEVKLQELDSGKEYLLASHWFNYYHWFTETLVRLWRIKNKLNDYVLLLPESYRHIAFVTESLNAFDVRNIRWVNEGAVLHVPHLTLVENKPYCNHYDPVQMKAIGEFFREYAASHGKQPIDFGEKIFITRKNAARRKLRNEHEAEEILQAYGFVSVPIEQYSLMEEILIMSKAKYLIGMHGAGLTNMLFMPPGGKVLELHREVETSADMHSDVYWKLVAALGHSYYYQFCKPADTAQNFFEADLIINKAEFEVTCQTFLS